MYYYEIRLNAPGESRDAIINRLAELGATGFVEYDEDIIAYFEGTVEISTLCEDISAFRAVLEASGLDPGFSYKYSTLPEKDWNETWKKNFTPIDIGRNLTIIPSWLDSETERIPIIIDPGMVFGTGYHETTQTCLVLIEKISESTHNRSCLDVGTGSGILAIGAARLGFREVTAVDIDPMAIDAAKRNVIENSLDNIEVRHGDILSVNGSFDLIAANLLSGILIDIAPEIVARLNPGGNALLSGMLAGQEDGVTDAFVRAGLSLKDTVVNGKWVTLVFS
jgi:ribosomal protein L11 methyltransferase